MDHGLPVQVVRLYIAARHNIQIWVVEGGGVEGRRELRVPLLPFSPLKKKDVSIREMNRVALLPLQSSALCIVVLAVIGR